MGFDVYVVLSERRLGSGTNAVIEFDIKRKIWVLTNIAFVPI